MENHAIFSFQLVQHFNNATAESGLPQNIPIGYTDVCGDETTQNKRIKSWRGIIAC